MINWAKAEAAFQLIDYYSGPPYLSFAPFACWLTLQKMKRKKREKAKKIEVSYLWAIILFVFVVAITQTT